MSQLQHELGGEDFAAARRRDRARGAEARLHERTRAKAALEAACEAFADQAQDVQDDLRQAALRDCEILQDMAERVLDIVRALEPAFDRLDVARDLQEPSGTRIRRRRSRYLEAELAERTAEVLGEALLCGPAAAVFTAAVRHRALG